MDTPDAGGRDAADVLPVILPKSAGPKSASSNGFVGLETVPGSVPTEPNDALSVAAASARAAVIASSVSSMAALLCATAVPSVRLSTGHFSVRSTSLRDAEPMRSISTQSHTPIVSTEDVELLFQGHAPWPKEGPSGEEERVDSGDGELTAVTPAPTPTPTPAATTDSTAVSKSPCQRHNISPTDEKIDPNQGASTQARKEVVEEGAGASKRVREAQMKKGNYGPCQRPGWKYVSPILPHYFPSTGLDSFFSLALTTYCSGEAQGLTVVMLSSFESSLSGREHAIYHVLSMRPLPSLDPLTEYKTKRYTL